MLTEAKGHFGVLHLRRNSVATDFYPSDYNSNALLPEPSLFYSYSTNLTLNPLYLKPKNLEPDGIRDQGFRGWFRVDAH